MLITFKHIVLADDDEDDRVLFRDAVEELKMPAQLTTVTDGEQLLKYLSQPNVNEPDVIFMDLNMPRKNGFACLRELKSSPQFANIPVIIFSTAYEPGIAALLYDIGAHYFIRKPGDFPELKKLISRTFTLLQEIGPQPPKEKFLIKNPNVSP